MSTASLAPCGPCGHISAREYFTLLKKAPSDRNEEDNEKIRAFLTRDTAEAKHSASLRDATAVEAQRWASERPSIASFSPGKTQPNSLPVEHTLAGRYPRISSGRNKERGQTSNNKSVSRLPVIAAESNHDKSRTPGMTPRRASFRSEKPYMSGTKDGSAWLRETKSVTTSVSNTPALSRLNSGRQTSNSEPRQSEYGGLPILGTPEKYGLWNQSKNDALMGFPEDMLQALPRRNSTMTVGSTASASRSTTEWKDDDKMKTWYENIQKRKTAELTRKVRQANKDAQWILNRREAQMKDIQKRQKAEQDAESKARREGALKKMHRITTVPNLGVTKLQKKSRLVEMMVRKRKPKTDVNDQGVVILPHSGPEYGTTLPWVKMPDKKKLPIEKEIGVWIKPGVFCTKKALKMV